ncbi:MAG TPA: DUF177 domain-containing protein [Desulfopila sp.]|nr:DUF177 domain-containing protein [Desulfopila sp.]
MKIPWSEISAGGLRKVVADTGWSRRSGFDFRKAPQAEIVFRLSDDITAVLEGKIQAEVTSSCGRCGVPVDVKIDENFKYIFRLEEDSILSQQEVELSEEDIDTVFLDEPEIYVDEVLAEQLILSLPLRLLCDKNCKGLCPRCGVSLNEEQCSCEVEQTQSPFAVLKQLKK